MTSRMKTNMLALTLVVLFLTFTTNSALGYHLFYINNGGTSLVVRWQNVPVNVVVDNGPTDILSTAQTATTTWNAVTTAKDVFGSVTRATKDFTAENFETDWGIAGDGKVEIVVDEDGSIIRDILNRDPLTLNGQTPIFKSVVGGQGLITDGYIIMNFVPSRTDFDRLSTLVHELGHLQGIAHSSVGMHNSASFPTEALDRIDVASVPTMHPFSDGSTNRRTLEPDDKAALSELYPEPSFSSDLGSIEGTVTECFSSDAIIGANVRAINTSNPNIQLSRFSGYDGNNEGRFKINGLPAGSYRLVIEPMGANDFNIANRFGTPPFRQDQRFQTEYYNPPEEENCSEELPDTPTLIAVASGSNATDKNFKAGGADLAFVVDDTGSMSNEIGAVRTVLSNFVSITDTLNRTLGIPFPSVAIVTFKDDVTKRLVSKDPARLQNVINGLFASGGGDCPESSNAALITAGRLLKQGGRLPGVAMLFTDADSRPDGPDREAVNKLYQSKSARVFTLLSGSCSESISSLSPSQSPMPANRLPLGIFADEFPPPATLGFESSVRTFSEISNQTGGFFTAIPGIKTGNATERQRYINTGTNLAVSSAAPAIGLVSPGDGPQGNVLNVEVLGSNTNFQSSSTLTFSGGGITVNSQTVVSPVKINANISIESGAAQGFRDVSVSTNLGGGNVETAKGFGAFNVISSPSAPTILGVVPSSASQGQTLNVAISASNSNFVNGVSVANFGSGITVNSTTVLSNTSAVANITVDNAATIGFRDVRVITGPETALENVVGPFFVSSPPPVVPRVISVEPSQAARTQTTNVTISGENTQFVDGISVASFSGTGITVNSTAITSPTTAVANITVAADATLGFRDVFVTTGGEIASVLRSFQVTEALLDKDPPTITEAAVDKQFLQMPNHQMVIVTVDYRVTDNHDMPSAIVRSLSVISNEPVNGTGDGDTFPDWEILDANHVRLRAERDGKGEGRVYTITITATDSAGNSSTQNLFVRVPHDKR